MRNMLYDIPEASYKINCLRAEFITFLRKRLEDSEVNIILNNATSGEYKTQREFYEKTDPSMYTKKLMGIDNLNKLNTMNHLFIKLDKEWTDRVAFVKGIKIILTDSNSGNNIWQN